MLIYYRNVFFMDITNPKDSLQVCVKKCPDRDLIDRAAVQKFAMDTGSRLCSYNISIDQYKDKNLDYGIDGPCPKLPVLKG